MVVCERDAARYMHLNCKFYIRGYTRGRSELKVVTPSVPRVVHALSTRDSLAHLKSILNLPERDCVDIRVARHLPGSQKCRSRRIRFHSRGRFIRFLARSPVPIEWNGISTRANGNKSTGHFSPLFLSLFYVSFFFAFSPENMSSESTTCITVCRATRETEFTCAR